MLKMSLFKDRIAFAFDRENDRLKSIGQRPLTKTAIWKRIGVSSGAVSHWFDGSNGASLHVCEKIAGLLNCNPHWLFDESKKIDSGIDGQATHQEDGQANPAASPLSIISNSPAPANDELSLAERLIVNAWRAGGHDERAAIMIIVKTILPTDPFFNERTGT